MCSSSGDGAGLGGGGVPRTEGTQPELQFPNETGYYYRVLVQPPRPVWVRLDCLYIRDPGTPRHVNGSGLDMTGERPGTLTHWVPTLNGDWMGRVNFSVLYGDGRSPLHLIDQLVPAYALRPRKPRSRNRRDSTSDSPADAD